MSLLPLFPFLSLRLFIAEEARQLKIVSRRVFTIGPLCNFGHPVPAQMECY